MWVRVAHVEFRLVSGVLIQEANCQLRAAKIRRRLMERLARITAQDVQGQTRVKTLFYREM